jgi:competence protein ComEC
MEGAYFAHVRGCSRGLSVVVAGLDAPESARGWSALISALRGRAGELASLLGSVAPSLEAERARWIVWLPVLFGAGVVVYFHLAAEPALTVALAVPVMAAALKGAWRRGLAAAVVTGAVLTTCLGFAFAKARTEWVRAPVLARPMSSAEVAGYVTLVEPKAPRGQRITLRVTSISGLAHDALPRNVRIRAMRALQGLAPGDAVQMRARLSPPAEPALPGGYDFARAAWFSGLGAIGFALKAPEIDRLAGPPPRGVRIGAAIERLRQGIGARIVAVLPGETGAIANSLITGERGGISEETTDAFRDSGLLHILSISGLHMVIMAGAVFVALRMLAAAFPALALRYPTKKWAAGAALLAALGYLLISGSSVATVRSFIMIAIMFLAIIVDRPAVAMRNVALAAMVILAAMPESVLDVGFQMSFAAVVSLVAVYEVVRERTRDREGFGALRRVAFFLGGIVLSTVIASVAVAPFAAYHFHKSQQFALIANLIAIPICNLVVMPAGLLTLVLMPLGLEALPLTVMAWGIDVIVWTAAAVASLPGAVARIPAMPEAAFGLMVAGGLWLALWRTRWRVLGAACVAAGVALTQTLQRPDILIGRGGSLVAVRGADGKLEAMSARGGNFELTRWLEHDGDAREARAAAAGRLFQCDGSGCTAKVKGTLVAVARHPSAFADDCAKARIVLASVAAPDGCAGPAAVIDFPALRRGGTHALYLDEAGVIRTETVAAARGDRPWSAQPSSDWSSTRENRDFKRQ